MEKMLIRAEVQEVDFGASTSALFTLAPDNDSLRVVEAEDTSTHETNYQWDGWGDGELDSYIGLSLTDLLYVLSTRFDNWKDEYRRPTMRVY